jgi:hypothetical protein
MKYRLMKYNVIVLLSVTFLSTCVVNKTKKSTIIPKPVSTEIFLTNPFGYEPTIKNLKTQLPSYKLQIYTTKNKFYPNLLDSIFRFYHKKNELFVYKTGSKRELFVAANIYDINITLQNGIKVGISRMDFFKCFNDLKQTMNDTIRMVSRHTRNSYNFIFKQEKLKAIKIDNYID